MPSLEYFFYQTNENGEVVLGPKFIEFSSLSIQNLLTFNEGSFILSPLSSLTATGSALPASAIPIPWDNIYNKPLTYPPTSHTHEVSDFIDLYNFHWNNVTNKPSGYAPLPHTHNLVEALSPLPPGPVQLNQIKNLSATSAFLALTSTEAKRDYLKFHYYDTQIDNAVLDIEIKNGTTGKTYFWFRKKFIESRIFDPIFKVTGSASTNTFTISSTHNFVAGDLVRFLSKNGSNISLSSNYYIVDPVTVTDFKVSTTPFGTPVSLGTNMVSGTIQRKKSSGFEDDFIYLNIDSSQTEPEYIPDQDELELTLKGGSGKTGTLSFFSMGPIIYNSRFVVKDYFGDLSLLQKLYFNNTGKIFTFNDSKKLQSLQGLSFQQCGLAQFALRTRYGNSKIKTLEFHHCVSPYFTGSFPKIFEITDARWFKDLEFIMFNDCGDPFLGTARITDQSYTLPESKVKLLLEALDMPNSLNGFVKILKLKTTGTSTLTSLINSLQSKFWQIDLLVV